MLEVEPLVSVNRNSEVTETAAKPSPAPLHKHSLGG